MKKFVLASVLALSFMTISAMPAYAASLHVSAKTRVRATNQIVFTAKTTRPSRVRIAVYKRGKIVRRIRAHKSGRRYVAVWNQRDSKGRTLASGTYAYRVTAVRKSVRRTVRGTVKLRRTVPVLTPTPTPTPTSPTSGPTATSADGWFGFYVDGNLDTMGPLLAEQSAVATQAHVAQLFMADDEPFPAARVNAIIEQGSIPLVTLQFESIRTGGLDAIIAGRNDPYIVAFADAAKANGNTVWLRPFHEMNGDWDAWSATVGNNTPAKLVQAWRRVHGIFVARGATNVKFVWCPNDNGPTPIEDVWPGDDYIDYAAVDIYNFGTTETWSHWTPFARSFPDPYNRITKLTNKPFFIAEIGCAEAGGDKAAWVADMFEQIRTNFPRVEGMVWFNCSRGKTDWRVESSPASLAAFKTEIARGF